MRFLQMLLNGGTLDGKRILSARTVAYMTADHLGDAMPGPYYLPGPGYGFSLAFAVRREQGVSAVQGSVGEYTWGGAGGTAYWVDPAQDMLVVFMMQSPTQRTFNPASAADCSAIFSISGSGSTAVTEATKGAKPRAIWPGPQPRSRTASAACSRQAAATRSNSRPA